jgi:hypothetical protein
VNAFEAGDNRKAVAILDFKDWAAKTGAYYGKGYEDTGYFNRKYIPRKKRKCCRRFKLDQSNNYRSIRYADVLLMAAEAYNRSGLSDVKARGYLNQVRRRALEILITYLSIRSSIN